MRWRHAARPARAPRHRHVEDRSPIGIRDPATGAAAAFPHRVCHCPNSRTTHPRIRPRAAGARLKCMTPPRIARPQPGGEPGEICAGFRRTARRRMPSAPPRRLYHPCDPPRDRRRLPPRLHGRDTNREARGAKTGRHRRRTRVRLARWRPLLQLRGWDTKRGLGKKPIPQNGSQASVMRFTSMSWPLFSLTILISASRQISCARFNCRSCLGSGDLPAFTTKSP